jgi:predicted DNA-binding transcriptional regulator AlpA
MSTAQERFDASYITSSEICQRLKVTRPAIHFRRQAKLLPDPIQVFGRQLLIWERDAIEPWLQKWQESLQAKRGAKA